MTTQAEKDHGLINDHRPEYHEGYDQALESIAGMVTNSGNTK
jgi:hypothetical protein